MQLSKESISVVMIGDWNLLYIQPEWIAENIFECSEIEIGIEQRGVAFQVLYKKDQVIIKPTQTKIVFSSLDVQDDTLAFFAKCINNYINKATTPLFNAYGLNLDYIETEDTRLADVFDTMTDTETILDLGYEIASTKVTRKLLKGQKIITMQCTIDRTQTKIHFNEHHENPTEESIDITDTALKNFIYETKQIVEGLGYEIEGE